MFNPKMVLTVISHKLAIILTILAGVKLVEYLKILGKNLMQLIIKLLLKLEKTEGLRDGSRMVLNVF